MKMLRPSRLGALLLLAPVLALAHPGHDGPHDFEWDFAHFGDHPVATTASLAVLLAAATYLVIAFRSRQQRLRAERAKR